MILKQRRLFILALMVIGVVIIAGLFLFTGSPYVQAQRFLVTDGDIYRVNTVTGAYRLTNSKDIQILFDESGNDLLVGKGLEGGVPEAEKMDGTKLYLVKNDTGESKPLTDKLVSSAFFDTKKSHVYFVTLDQELYSVRLSNDASKLLKEKVLDPSLSPDGGYIVYAKLNSDWKVGDYYDKVRGLAVLNLETGVETLITNSPADFSPSWTPDGTRIVFMSDVSVEDTPAAIQKIPLKDYQRVPDAAFHPAKPEFAEKPSGGLAAQPVNADGTVREEFTQVAIPAVKSNHTAFFSVKRDGSERTQLITEAELKDKKRKPPVPSSALSWSGDGKSFVYDSDGSIWTGLLDRSGTKLTAKKIGSGREPKWMKDTALITATPVDREKGIIKMKVDGTILK